MTTTHLLTKKERLGSLFAAFFVAALDNFGFAIVFILFSPLILDPTYKMVAPEATLGQRNLILGVLFASFPLTQFFGAPFFGDLADHIGRKKALYITVLGCTLGYIFSGIAIWVKSLTFLLISRLLSGFFAGNLSLCLAAIADLSGNEKSRSKNFGFITVVWGLSWFLAILTGGMLSNPRISSLFSPSLPFWLTAALTFLNFVAVKFFYKETYFAENKTRLNPFKGIQNIFLSFRIKKTRLFFLVLFVWILGWGVAVQWYAPYSIELFNMSQTALTWSLVIQGAFWTLGGSLINPILVKRFASINIALSGCLITSAFFALSSLFDNFYIFTLCYWLAACFGSFAMSNTLNLCSISASGDVQGKIMGLSQSMLSLGWLFVPIFGALSGNINIRIFYPFAAFMHFLAFALLVYGKRND